MEIGTGQQLCVPIIEPFLLNHCLAFGTVSVPAGVVGVSGMAAPVTGLDMAAQGRSPAYLDTLHDFVLLSRQYVLIPVLHPISSEDICHLRRSAIVFHLPPPSAHPSGRADS